MNLQAKHTMKKTQDQPKQKAEEVMVEQKNEADEWKLKYLRALADYQNLEKRSDERVSHVRMYAAEMVLSRLLPVVDTFSKVQEHIKDPGLDLAYKELLSVLTEQGVSRIEVVGKEFNPEEMDCIEVVSGKENEVVEEVMPGYRFRDKVLRVARVKVGTTAPKSN